MALTMEDISYLDIKFGKLCDDISKIDTKVDNAKLETAQRLTKLETELGIHIKERVDESTKKYKMISTLTTIGLGVIGSLTGVNILT